MKIFFYLYYKYNCFHLITAHISQILTSTISPKYSPLLHLPNTHFYHISQILTYTISPKYSPIPYLSNTHFYHISQILTSTTSPKYSLLLHLPNTHFYYISQILTSTTSPKYSLIRNFLTSSNISPYFHHLLTPQNVLLPLTTAVT